jgi:LysR family transcriptional regulator, cys regulon transcriptional activator
MNIPQLRLLASIARHSFNLTEVAAALHTVPSAISKRLRELEDELGVELVMRKGKRVLGFTDPGAEAARLATEALEGVDNLRRLAADYRQADAGELVLATTHTQARYALPDIIARFRADHPRVHLALHQENPENIARMVVQGTADIGIATESLHDMPALATFDFYEWGHRIVVPRGHPLAVLGRAPRLDDVARWPIVTYHPGFTGRGLIDQTFADAGLNLDIVLSALDADVIKTYVTLGLGVGIIASVAYDAKADAGLVLLPCEGLERQGHTRIALRRGRYLREYVFRFVELCVPGLSAESVKRELATIE